MLAKATGLTFFRALSFSLFVYPGAGQMAAVTMLAQNVAYVISIFTVFINKLYMSLTIFLYIWESIEEHKYRTPYQVVKMINPNSKEDMELLSKLPWITDNFDDDEDE